VATIFKPTYKRPLPKGAKIVTRKGQQLARWKDGAGRTRSAPLSEDGKSIVLEYRHHYIEYFGPDGRRIRVKGYTDREATEQLARDTVKLSERIQAGCVTVDMDRARMPLTEALDAWLADLRRRGNSDGYVYNMGLLVRRMADACNWPTLGSIRSDSLTSWLADLNDGKVLLPSRKKRKDAGPPSGRTLNQYLETARAFVNWCCRQKPLPWLAENPLDGIDKADESEVRRQKRAFTLDELGRLKVASGKRWVIYLTAALTGLRRSELARLQWGDLQLEAVQPFIQLRAAATKAKRADTVAVNPELRQALLADRPDAVTTDARVFPVVPKYETFKRDVVKRAKIPWRDDQNRLASFHALRKTFGTYLALANVPLREMMEMMRVTEARLVTSIYTDASLFNKSAAASRLPSLNGTSEAHKSAAG
jgi:integrase